MTDQVWMAENVTGIFGAVTFECGHEALVVDELQTSFCPAGLGYPVSVQLGSSKNVSAKPLALK